MKTKILKLLLVSAVVFAACDSKYSDLGDGLYADIETDKGAMIAELYAEDAPLTVANFITLAEGTNPKVPDSIKGKKYYDGLGFHRVVKNFIIQGGDPAGTGSGPLPGYTFYDELSTDRRHDSKGILSMANRGVNTNGSQFFITHKPTPWLDGYTADGVLKDCGKPRVGCHSVFGKVISGLEVVDSIAQYDMIKSIKIVRKGSAAKSFDAVKVFNEGLAKAADVEKERLAKVAAAEKTRYETFVKECEAFYDKMGVAKATKTDSGLQYLKLNNTRGKKVTSTDEISINYTLYLGDGKRLQSSLDKGGKPFVFTIDDKSRPLIPGFKEGLLKLRQGEKARLFIPYYIAYGERGGGPFPPKADILFEVEVLKVGK